MPREASFKVQKRDQLKIKKHGTFRPPSEAVAPPSPKQEMPKEDSERPPKAKPNSTTRDAKNVKDLHEAALELLALQVDDEEQERSTKGVLEIEEGDDDYEEEEDEDDDTPEDLPKPKGRKRQSGGKNQYPTVAKRWKRPKWWLEKKKKKQEKAPEQIL